jgi:adenine-specific DNA-methyltransferase
MTVKADATSKSDQEKEQDKQKTKASANSPMRSSAGVRPHDVDDRKVSLEDRLRSGFMAAYNNRHRHRQGLCDMD